MRGQWQIWSGLIRTPTRRTLPSPHGTSEGFDTSPLLNRLWPVDSSFFLSGAGYTFGSGVVRKFLSINSMSHILRAHQLCMEGFSVLFDKRLSTVWSAPNYCYRCGNSASILEVGPGGAMHFNVFDAAPENERDGPNQQQTMQANGGNKVRNQSFRWIYGRLIWPK